MRILILLQVGIFSLIKPGEFSFSSAEFDKSLTLQLGL